MTEWSGGLLAVLSLATAIYFSYSGRYELSTSVVWIGIIGVIVLYLTKAGREYVKDQEPPTRT